MESIRAMLSPGVGVSDRLEKFEVCRVQGFGLLGFRRSEVSGSAVGASGNAGMNAYVCIYRYIYIERERERETPTGSVFMPKRHLSLCIRTYRTY